MNNLKMPLVSTIINRPIFLKRGDHHLNVGASVDEKCWTAENSFESIFNTLVYIKEATETQREPDDLENLLCTKLMENTFVNSTK